MCIVMYILIKIHELSSQGRYLGTVPHELLTYFRESTVSAHYNIKGLLGWARGPESARVRTRGAESVQS